MKKIISLILLLIVIKPLFSLEIRCKNIIEAINNRPILRTRTIIDLFYDKNILVVVYANTGDDACVYRINADCIISNSKYENNKEDDIFNRFFENGIFFNLKYGFRAIFSSDEYDFKNEMISTIHGDNPMPFYMYISNNKNDVVFNFNIWRLNQPDFYPKTYYTSLSEEKDYTLEQQINQLRVCPASTEWQNHTAVNKKQNRVAVVFDKYNGDRGALCIFEVLYDAVCNDDKVRVRKEPNLNCDTVTFINKNDSVKIKDQSDRKFEIDGEEFYWHEVELPDGKTGWVYGKYLDIEK